MKEEKRKLLLIKHRKNYKDLIHNEPPKGCCVKWAKAVAVPINDVIITKTALINAVKQMDMVNFCPTCGKAIVIPYVPSVSSSSPSISSISKRAEIIGTTDWLVDPEITTQRSLTNEIGSDAGSYGSMVSDSESLDEDDPLDEMIPLPRIPPRHGPPSLATRIQQLGRLLRGGSDE